MNRAFYNAMGKNKSAKNVTNRHIDNTISTVI